MSRQRHQAVVEADGLVSRAERLTEMRLFLTKDLEIPHQVRTQRIQQINQELQRIEIRLAELEVGG